MSTGYQIITLPTGEDVQFPSDMSDEAISAAIQQDLANTGPPQEPPMPISEELMGDLSTNWDELGERLGGVYERSGSPSEYAQTTMSQGVRTFGDTVGTLLKHGWKALPDFLTEPTETSIDEFQEYMLQYPTVQDGIQAAQEGMEAYEKWKEANPYDANMAENTIDIAAVMFPRVNPIRPTAVKVVNQSALGAKVARVQETLEPEPNTGPGTWDETSRATGARAVYDPTPPEIEMYEIVEAIPEYNPNRSSRKNAATVRKHVDTYKAETDRRILDNGNPQIDVNSVKEELSQQMSSILDGDGMGLMPNAERVAERVLTEAYKIIDASDGTALGLLNARRKIDDIIRKTRGKGAYDADRINGVDAAARIARTLLNDSVIDAVPDANVHDLLNKQHQLLKAHDILNTKAIKEPKNAWGRLMKSLKDMDLVPATVLGLGATAGTAGNLLGAGAAASIAIGAGGLYVGGKLLNPTNSKRVLGSVLEATNKAINKAQKSQVAKLKADRALLLEYMRSLTEQEELPVGEVSLDNSELFVQ